MPFLIFHLFISLIRRENSLDRLKVHCGTNYQNQAGEVYSVSSVSIHKDFSLIKLINDVALIHLKTPIKFNAKVQPIKLTTTNVDDGPCKLTGWGSTRVCKLIIHYLSVEGSFKDACTHTKYRIRFLLIFH